MGAQYFNQSQNDLQKQSNLNQKQICHQEVQISQPHSQNNNPLLLIKQRQNPGINMYSLLKGGPLGSQNMANFMQNLNNQIIQQKSHISLILPGADNVLFQQHSIPKQTNQKTELIKSRKESQKWLRQHFLKYTCFLQRYQHQFTRKNVWISNKCSQYLGFKNKSSFTLKQSHLKTYHQTIGAIICHLRRFYKFTKDQIHTQMQNLNDYTNNMRFLEFKILEKPLEFQNYLQTLKFYPIKQVCSTRFNRTKFESKFLSYVIINLYNQPKRQFFDVKAPKGKHIFVLFEAQFRPQETQFEKIKPQIIENQDVQNIENVPSNLIQQQKKQYELNIKEQKVSQKIKIGQKDVQYNQTWNNCFEKYRQQKRQINHGTQIVIDQQNQLNQLYTKQNLGKISQSLLDLSFLLGLLSLQIQKLELMAQIKLYEFRIMKKSILWNLTKNTNKKAKQSNKLKSFGKSIEYNDIKNNYNWTQEQVLRIIAFMTLNQKLFKNIHDIKENLISLMVQFVKNRTVQSAQKKYDLLTEKVHSLEQLLQNVFNAYQFTDEQFQLQLKRQYQKYQKYSSTLIFKGEKIQTIRVSSQAIEEEVCHLINKKILENVIELTCLTQSKEDDKLREFIQQKIKQFKQFHNIKYSNRNRNLSKVQIQ